MTFSKSQMFSLEVTERVTSVLSLIGTSFIIATFLISTDYHKPINRLVFYASFGNIITNVATLVSTSSIHAGATSPLCQLQAFLIQMFMPADSLWTLAMACNVYLVFFKKYSSAQLRKLELKYFIACYGIPSIPAITYLFVNTKERGKPYGPATLWCWITPKWDPLRVATFYGPVWLVVVVTMFIYTIVGFDIYKKRQQLRQFSQRRPTNDGPCVNKITQVEVTSEPAAVHHGAGDPWELTNVGPEVPAQSYMEYSITIESGAKRRAALERPLAGIDTNSASWGYARIAFIFFVALLVTWVPSSVNRVYSLAHPNKPNFPANFVASLVLPLQGFWNGLIYFIASLPESRKLWRRMTGRTANESARNSRELHGPVVYTRKTSEHPSTRGSSKGSLLPPPSLR